MTTVLGGVRRMIPSAMQVPTQNRTLNDPIEQDYAQTLPAIDCC